MRVPNAVGGSFVRGLHGQTACATPNPGNALLHGNAKCGVLDHAEVLEETRTELSLRSA